MVTLKLKYIADDNFISLISDYQRQYSNYLHIMYNRISDTQSIKETELRNLYSSINNCSLINKWLFQCSIKEAKQIYNSHGNKVIFGGKLNYCKRAANKISKEEYKAKRLNPIYSIGEANQKGNRLFKLKQNQIVTFQPTKLAHFDLQLTGLGKTRTKTINKLFELAQARKIGLTYKLSKDYIWISYDEKEVEHISTRKIQNRVFAIGLNPNYVGWSITDWKSSSKFNIIKEGVISIKKLNNYDVKCKVSSTNRKHISNFRRHVILEICKKLVDTAIYYRCDTFALEDLNFTNKLSFTRFNRLCRNQWNRDLFVQNIKTL